MGTRIIRLTALGGLLTGAGLLCGCQPAVVKGTRHLQPFTEVSGRTEVTEEIARLVVENRVGDVTLVADAVGEIRIEAKVRLEVSRHAATDKGTFADHVRLNRAGDTVTVADAHMKEADRQDWAVTFVIHTPPRLAARVTTGVGDVDVRDLEGDLTLASGVGEISVEGRSVASFDGKTGTGKIHVSVDETRGKVAAITATGDVTLQVRSSSPSANVDLRSGVGDVRLALPPGSTGTFELATGVGSISVTGHEGIRIERMGPSVRGSGRVGDGGPRYELHTGVGSITIGQP